MKTLFESILNNHIILFETKVNAKRHFTNEEAKEIVDIVKQSIDDGTFDIVDRKKNRDYLKAEKLTKKTAAQIVKMFLQPKSLRAVLVDRNGISNELFVFSIAVPFKGKTKYIYFKAAIHENRSVSVISFHEQTEMMRVDYRNAEDRMDDDSEKFFASVFKKWQQKYNAFNRDNKMVSFRIIDDENIELIFEHNILNSKQCLHNVCRSVPSDYGYHYNDIKQNISTVQNRVLVNLPF